MFKLKVLGFVAAVVLCAFDGMASNFRAADQVYIPAAGKVAGSSGIFISDVFIANMSTDTITVSVIYSSGATGTQQYFNNLFDLAAGERREFVDFFVSALGLQSGFGQLIFNACKKNEDCVASQDNNGVSPHYRNIAVQSRIYSVPSATPNAPTTGQLFAGVPWYNFVSSDMVATGLDKTFITGVRNTGGGGQPGTYRGNIGIVNASQFCSTDIVVTLKNGSNGAQLGQTVKRLGPLGHLQFGLGGEFPSFTGPTATNAYIEFEQRNNTPTSDSPTSCLPNGCPAFFAYGSVLDNISGDATTLEPMYTRALSDAAIAVIYPFTNTTGRTTIRRVATRR